MFNFSTIASRVQLLGMVPLCLLLLVLIASFQAAATKDQLFHRLYHEHLAILSGVMQSQKILQQQADSAYSSIAQADVQAKDSVEQARATEQQFRQLAAEVATLSDINQQISLAGNKQQQTAGRFVSGIAAMHQASQQLHQGASQSSQAAEELTALAAELERGWQQFRTN